MTTSREEDYHLLTDEQVEICMIFLESRKAEAIRIYRLAKETLRQVEADYNTKMAALKASREPPALPRMDSNHKGMD